MCRISSFFVCQNLDNNKLYKAGDEGFYLIIKDFDHDRVDNGQLIEYVCLHGKSHVYVCLPLNRLKILVLSGDCHCFIFLNVMNRGNKGTVDIFWQFLNSSSCYTWKQLLMCKCTKHERHSSIFYCCQKL